MNQLIVPISFTKIQFSKISSLWRRGKKVLVKFFLWSPFLNQMKAFIHAPPSIALGKSNTGHRETICLQKAFLLFLQQLRQKQLWTQMEKFDASLHCYLTQPSLSFSAIIEKFRWSHGLWNDATWYGRQLTNSFTFVFTFTVGYLMGWSDEKKGFYSLKINTSRLLREKKLFRDNGKELIREKCMKNDFVHVCVVN